MEQNEYDERSNLLEELEDERYPFGIPIVNYSVPDQMAFIRKTWAIFTIHVFLILSTASIFILTYKSNDDFQPPWYLILIYALVNSYVIGSLICLLRLYSALEALLILFINCLSLLGFTNQNTYKFKSKESVILTIITTFASTSILYIVYLENSKEIEFYDAIIAFLIALPLSLFFIFDTWYLMKSMNKKEFWGASVQLILDLFAPFKFIQ
ncbi:2162_t:CDS:2 [Diversispora eburnea]|uniref:2162_t:CDS:1 n=1 Tax=Diversispora eburnea TaxID=1213867 RepID=A0A9N8VG15_9GLOM|nr:2162_t:CDS:2 [Diversispora eburnea]